VLFSLVKEKKSGFKVDLQDNDVWMEDLIKKFKPEDRPNVEITAEDTALFQYSGGTTGVSKGVVAGTLWTCGQYVYDPRLES
jgi:long-chain acyl-CoA synthetase